MKITYVQQNSIAAEIGLLPGDQLVSINGEKIRDVIDYQFQIGDDQVEIEIKRGDETFFVDFEDGVSEDLGLEFEELKCHSCGNNCIFCFIDQHPNGVRDTLLFKDEDYRMSFLYGNYVTLTNTSKSSQQRIVDQRLSPIYISVHATRPDVRRTMLGIRGNDKILQKIAYFAENKITMHTQIVLCPGFNDGLVLEETVNDLAAFFPWVNSIAIVPVGLTKYRDGLPKLTSVTPELAKEILAWEKEKTADLLKLKKSYLIYLADEFYLLAEESVPAAERYMDFAQIENGVGMVRRLLDDFAKEKPKLPKRLKPTAVTLVTGQLAAPILQKEVLPVLKKIAGLEVTVRAIKNEFFGGGVTVAGLLTGADIASQLKNTPVGDLVVLPPNCLNYDNLFLDDWTVEQLEKVVGARLIQTQHGFLEIFDYLN